MFSTPLLRLEWGSSELGAEVCVAHGWKPQAIMTVWKVCSTPWSWKSLAGKPEACYRHWRGRVEGGDGRQASLQRAVSSFHTITLGLVHPCSSAKCHQGPCAVTRASSAVRRSEQRPLLSSSARHFRHSGMTLCPC